MTVNIYGTRWAALLLVGITASLVAGCSAQPQGAPASSSSTAERMMVSGTYVIEEDLQGLADRSDLVVVGTLQDDPESVSMADLGTGPDSGGATKVAELVYTVDVDEVLKGDLPDEVKIARLDSAKVVSDDQGSTPVGSPVVLFLSRGAVGVYGTVGGEQGFVPVEADQLKWRAPSDPTAFPQTLDALRTAL